MTKIIMHGCNGAMGQVITDLAREDSELEIVAGIDIKDHGANPYPVFESLRDCQVKADVIIDFASSKAIDSLLEYGASENIPMVICTTGLIEEQVEKIKKTSESVAVLRSANMSLGINLLQKLIQEAANVLAGAGFDIEIVEKHHNKKVDAPSGTALALADSLNEALDQKYRYTYDRSSRRQKRDELEIGISAIRGGTIVGEHDVIFAGTDEVITFQHTAYSKRIFAKGALAAAKYLAGKGPGMYQMSDVIG